ncbi:MAG TPA: UDP-N-acetylmuramoyl-tripeptide--D-alanyl-D-alanine ligase [Bacillota bacterium]
MASFTIDEILTATGGRLLTGEERRKETIYGVCTDSRKVRPHDLFLALEGENFDGHDFIAQAVSAGASAVITAKDVPMPPEVSVIKVPDTLVALGDLARFHRRRFRIPVIAVTGSNGKTTTKELIATVLGLKYQVVKTKLNFNNEIGLPLTLLEMNQSTEAVVVEMGMRGRGQISYLARIAEPTIGVITNVGLTHLELLGSKQAIAEAKAELITALPANGTAILNGDDPLVAAMQSLFLGRTYFYGRKAEILDLRAVEIARSHPPARAGQLIMTDGKWGRFSFFLPLPGEHNVMNALAAVTVGLTLGITPPEFSQVFAALPEMEKRLRIIENKGIIIIDDTYNASPSSVKAALKVLADQEQITRRVAVLGDMLELGEFSREAHREVGRAVAACGCSALFTLGPHSVEMVSAVQGEPLIARHYQKKSDLLDDLLAYISPGDAILIKGSRGMQMEEIVSALLSHLA